MKTKLQKSLFILAFSILGIQVVSAQYVGLPFSGTAIQIGQTQNVATRIEMEDFDRTADYIDGLNTGSTVLDPPLTGTYSDKSTESPNTNPYRPAGSVDLAADATGHVITGVQGAEYTLYTIELKEDGDYDFTLNYKINNGVGNKTIQLVMRDPVTLARGAGDIIFNGVINTGTGAYENMKVVDGLPLTAGTYVFQFRTVSGGPRFDYIDVTRTSTLSVEENKLKASTFKAFPNPANDGLFNLNIVTKWNVYTLLGTKVLEGEGKKVDISTFAKGAYILRTPFTSKMLLSK